MAIEEKVEEFIEKNCKIWEEGELTVDEIVRLAYIAGAKENGIIWHNVKENPNDLPDDCYDVLNQCSNKIHYNFHQNVWMNEKDEIDDSVIAWCEKPYFEG